MDSIIRKNAHGDSLVHPSDFAKLVRTPMRMAYTKLYFFFASELELNPTNDPVVYSQMKKDSIRHLIPYKGRYFDYTVHKEYNTLEEWAADNGKTTSDVLYGVNRIYNSSEPIRAYITLIQLLQFLDPNYKSETVVEVTDKQKLLAQFDFLLKQMNTLRATIEKLQ